MSTLRLPTPTASLIAEGGEPFVVELDSFQGPLDLLLHLIRSQDIDIFDIPIARITAQFIAALDAVESQLSLERSGEFLEMAAALVRIKAQMLLPRRADTVDEDPRSDLVRRLLEYEQFREVAYALASAEQERCLHFGKGYIPPRPTPDVADRPLEFTLEQFVEIAVSLPAPPAGTRHTAPIRTITVDEKIELWLKELARAARLTLESFVQRWKSRMHAIMSFLACLEMAKRGRVKLRQERPFTTLWVYSGEDDADS